MSLTGKKILFGMTGGIHVVDSGYTAFKGTMALKETIAR